MSNRQRKRPVVVSALAEPLEERRLLSLLEVTRTDESGPGSLREALANAAEPGLGVIVFKIPGDGPHVIKTSYSLPDVPANTSIQGYSQPGSRRNGSKVGSDAIIKVEIAGPG